MTRKSLLGLIAVVVVVITAGLLALPQRSEWTTSSPEALAEFEAGMEASQKLYLAEARKHWERALELDPDFVAAKVRVAESCRYEDQERATALLADATAADQQRLTAREQFLIRRANLLAESQFEQAGQELDSYVEEHPDDPYVLHIKALRDWQRGELDSAERLNKRLLEINPNWVLAYNQLGYITMMQGRFAEAEEHFSSYRFIAPDQANPHDSLGELFILLGRYDEAKASLEQALANKPDFVAAFDHLALLAAVQGEWEDAAAWVERAVAADAMPEEHAESLRCQLELSRLAVERDWEAVIALAADRCRPEEGTTGSERAIHVHHAACRTDRWELAETIETEVREELEATEEGMGAMVFESLGPMIHHMAGVRHAVRGNLEAAIAELETADEHLSYLNANIGVFKLANRLATVSALADAGEESRARTLMNAVQEVNPRFARRYAELCDIEPSL